MSSLGLKATIDFEKLKAMFDIAISSMDFGSGFLDDEEVKILRYFAVVLGVDPMEATPIGFKTKFAHEWTQPERQPWMNLPEYATETEERMKKCKHCEKTPLNHPPFENDPHAEDTCAVCGKDADGCRASGCDAQYCGDCFTGTPHEPRDCDV